MKQRWSSLWLVGFVVLSLSACSSVVAGKPKAGAKGPVVEQIDYNSANLRDDFEASPKEVDNYWKSRDLSSIAGIGVGAPEDATQAPSDEATGAYLHPTSGFPDAAAKTGLGDASQGGLFNSAGLAGKTQGRLYMELDGGHSVCSATVINSQSKDLIATAAHCLWDTAGSSGLVNNVMFIPADNNDGTSAPYGRWYGTESWIPSEFKNNAKSSVQSTSGEGWAYDFAFVRVAPNSQNKKIQEVTGGQGIAFGIPVDNLVVTGYPTASPFDGTSQRYCAATAASTRRYARGGFSISCAMTQGSSGGGWLARYDPKTGAGYVVGMTSTGGKTDLNANALGQSALLLFQKAKGGL